MEPVPDDPCSVPPAPSEEAPPDAAERLGQLWRQGRRPDVDAFLAEAGPRPPADLAVVLRVDQRERWQAGERVPAESYLQRYPQVRVSAEAAVDLVYGEFLLRERHGERPSVEEYRQRFPEHADTLRAQIELHRAMAADAGSGPGPSRSAEAETLAPVTPAPGAPAWPRVPGYEILGELGRGGMGVVYRARQTALNREVALKMVLAGEHAGAAERARFRAEAEAVARLSHPNVVQIHEVGEHDGLPFFSLEYCPGGSLAGRLDGTPWPARRAAELVETLARGVHAAHQAGVVHRDLKPANVLLTADGIPKVTDFGLAKRLDVDTGQTQSGAIVGTPSYMAPEQAAGRPKDVGPAADVYALGAILYELLTGRPPFRAATPLDTVLQVVGDDPVPPRRLQPMVPRDLETVCLKCLDKQPRRRYASAAALAADLRRFLAGEPVTARPVTSVERALKWARRRPAVAGLLLLVAAVTLTGVGLVAWKWREAEYQRGLVVRKAGEAQQARTATEQQLLRAETALYVNQVAQAQRALRDFDLGGAERLLDECQPDKRHWEHGYLTALLRRRLRTLAGHTARVGGVAFGPDGKTIASGGADQAVLLWDVGTGRKRATLGRHRGHVLGVAFSRDGRRLASAGGVWDEQARRYVSGEVKVWDVAEGRELLSLGRGTSAVHGVAFSPDGSRLAGACADQTVRVWDAATGHNLLTLAGHSRPVLAVAFHPDGKLLASAGGDMTVKVWDTATGKERLTLPRQAGLVHGVAFSPDGTRLASAGGIGTQSIELAVWDVATGKRTLTLTGHTAVVRAVAYSADGRRLASASDDGTVRLWDTATGKAVLTLRGHSGPVTAVAVSPDGRHVASAGEDRTVKVWDTGVVREGLTLRHPDGVYSVAFSPDGKRLASSTGPDPRKPGEIRVWDLAAGKEPLLFPGQIGTVWCVAFSPDGTRLATGGYRGMLKLWDSATGRELQTLPGHSDLVASVAFSPDGTRLASAGGDRHGNRPGEVKVWDLAGGKEVLALPGLTGCFLRVAFSPDGTRLACYSVHDQAVKVWDALTGREELTLPGPAESFALAFSPDGARLASAGGIMDPSGTAVVAGEVKVWDAATGKEALALRGPAAVTSLAFSPDGARVAAACRDGSVRLWDAALGQPTLTLTEHAGPVTSIAFSPDGTRMGTASLDGTVKVWDAAPRDEGPVPGARP
jgi:WD40 repeat protein